MREERFFERIRRWAEVGPAASFEPDPELLIESIRSHIEQILSTRQGNVLMDKNYGLSSNPNLIENYNMAYEKQLIKNIKYAILRYEPRIMQIGISRIQIIPAKLCINCNIHARLIRPFEKIVVLFTTILTSKGRVIVKC